VPSPFAHRSRSDNSRCLLVINVVINVAMWQRARVLDHSKRLSLWDKELGSFMTSLGRKFRRAAALSAGLGAIAAVGLGAGTAFAAGVPIEGQGSSLQCVAQNSIWGPGYAAFGPLAPSGALDHYDCTSSGSALNEFAADGSLTPMVRGSAGSVAPMTRRRRRSGRRRRVSRARRC
jgi:hypothetical protein